jgi:hypothetical protein
MKQSTGVDERSVDRTGGVTGTTTAEPTAIRVRVYL